MNIKLKKKYTAAIIAVAVLLITASFLGFTGARTLAAFFVVFTLPAYLLLDLTGLKTAEKFFIATSLGLGLFSTAVFYVNRIIPSLRLSAAVVYVVVIALWLVLRRRRASRLLRAQPAEAVAAQAPLPS